MKKILLAFLCILTFSVSAVDKPNVLWLTIEDTSPIYIGCYGNSSAITPAIDSLAANGVRFTNAYSTGTACSPSRSCIITGMRPAATGNGHHRSAFPLSTKVKGFPSYLKAAGYYTSNNYKTDYNTSNAQRLIDESWNESSGQAHWRKRADGQPFFSIFNFADSHQSRTMTEPYEWYLQTVYNKLPEEYKVSYEDVFVPPFYRDSREMRKHMARMQNSINITDKQIGERLAQLEADGLMDETIIFFYSDHGEGMPRAKGNGIAQGYQVPMVIYFPEKYAHLNPWGQGSEVTEVVSFEDLAPTMLSLAGVTIPEHYRGRAFLGAARTEDPYVYGGRDRIESSQDFARSVMKDSFIYVRNFMTDRPEYNFMKYYDISEVSKAIRHDYWDGKLNEVQSLLMKPQRDQEFLFNISADPYEINNLAYDESYAALKEELSTQLKKEMREVKDVHLLPEYHLDLVTNPYDARLDDTILPIDTVLNVAWLSGSGPDVAAEQIKALESSIDLVRYWALVGLRAQTDELLKTYESELKSALADSYIPAQIEAAYICYRVFADEAAKTQLADFATNSNTFIATAAVQNISNLYEGGMAFKAALETVAANGHYTEQNQAQTFLHYYNKRELYWGNGNDYYWMAYSEYPFDSNTKDAKGNNDLDGSSLFVKNDDLRGKVLSPVLLQKDSALHFQDNFFLPKNYTVSVWLKAEELSSEKALMAFDGENLSVKVVANELSELLLYVNDTKAYADNSLKKDLWQQLQLSHWNEEYVLYLDGIKVASLDDSGVADILDGALLASPELYYDDLKIYHFPMTDSRAYGKYTEELILPQNTLRDEPVHWYKMDGNLEDAEGNLDLSEATATSFEQKGERTMALKLNGSSTTVIKEDKLNLNDAFSLSFLLNSSTTTRWTSPLSLGDESTFMYLCPYTSWTDGMYLVADNGLERQFYEAGNGAFPTDDWQHIAVTYAVGNWKTYIGGQLTADVTHQVDVAALSDLQLGALPHKDGGYFSGYMDELKIYDYALISSEILEDMKLSEEQASALSEERISDVLCYPNPAKDILNIQGEKIIDYLGMYDMSGRLVLKHFLAANSGVLNIKNLDSGLYVLSCLGEQLKEEFLIEVIN